MANHDNILHLCRTQVSFSLHYEFQGAFTLFNAKKEIHQTFYIIHVRQVEIIDCKHAVQTFRKFL